MDCCRVFWRISNEKQISKLKTKQQTVTTKKQNGLPIFNYGTLDYSGKTKILALLYYQIISE